MNKPFIRNGIFTTIDDNKSPRTFKELRGFLILNDGFDCFSKHSGEVYKITKNNTWIRICRCLTDLTYKEYLKESKK